MCDNEQVVYVGQSKNIAQRVKGHSDVKCFDSVYVLIVPWHKLDDVEAAFIRHLQPKYNADIRCNAEKTGFKKASPFLRKAVEDVFKELNFNSGNVYDIAA